MDAQERQKKPKHGESYLQFGFASVGDSTALDAQCDLRYLISANSSMVPAKLERHLHKKHSDCKYKPLDFFRRKCEELKQSKSNCRKYC
jgi:hypothetical protein